MKHYKILVLTDHSLHSDQNSIYTLLSEMLIHKQCKNIDVVSRGNLLNADFFTKQNAERIFATKVNADFQYDLQGKHFMKDYFSINLEDYDLVFMRLPRPITDNWLIWLKNNMPKAIFINDPLGIVNTSSKKYLLNFPALCPDMKLCRSVQEVEELANLYPIVLKPLKEYGGKGIVKIDSEFADLGGKKMLRLDYLFSIENELISDGYLAMKFLKNVSKGDKRILVVDGEIIACSLRLPAEGSWLCNISQGGKSVKTSVSPEEEGLIKKISPSLLDEGILIFGADTIENDDGIRVLSEVNTLSIGGFPQAQKQLGKPIIKLTIEKIFKYADAHE